MISTIPYSAFFFDLSSFQYSKKKYKCQIIKNMTGEIAILVFLFIVLIFLILIKNPSESVKWLRIAIGVALLGFTAKIAWSQIENMEEPTKVVNSVVDAQGGDFTFDMDDAEFSPYGNIKTSSDIDSMMQRNTKMDYIGNDEIGYNEVEVIDNSDLVEDFMQKGSSIFQPNTAQGVTATSSAYHSNFTLHEPGMFLQYSTPINSRGYTADEAMSRLQQHRSSINKRAIDGAVRTTKNRFAKFFANELDENEKRVWYSAEAADIETDFRPYE